jgi:hypothetical protein
MMATKRANLLGVVAAFVLVTCPASTDALTLGVTPPSLSVDAGTSFSVDIVISGLGAFAAPSLGTFDIDLGFDPAVVNPTGAVFTTLLGDEGLGEAISAAGLIGPGQFDLFLLSLLTAAELDALQPAEFVLATVAFDALAPGVSALALSIQALGDADGNALDAATDDGSVRVVSQVAVPLPASVVLLGAGVVLAGWLARRHRRMM